MVTGTMAMAAITMNTTATCTTRTITNIMADMITPGTDPMATCTTPTITNTMAMTITATMNTIIINIMVTTTTAICIMRTITNTMADMITTDTVIIRSEPELRPACNQSAAGRFSP
jgi:hypothetical protein